MSRMKFVSYHVIVLILAPNILGVEEDAYAEMLRYQPANFEYREIRGTRSYSNQRNASSRVPLDIKPYASFFKNCLLHVVNFNGMEISPPDHYPLALTRYRVVNLTYQEKRRRKEGKSNKLANSKKKVGQARIFPSEKFPPASSNISYCFNYDVTSRCSDFPCVVLTSSSKPWTCEVYLYAYPPVAKRDPYLYEWSDQLHMNFLYLPGNHRHLWYHQPDPTETLPEIFFNSETNKIMNSLLITRAQYHILLPDRSSGAGQFFKAIYSWIIALTVGRSGLIKVDYTYTPSNLEILMGEPGNFYWYCRYCHQCELWTPVQLNFVTSLEQMQHLIDKAHKTNIGTIFWNTYLEETFYNQFHEDNDDKDEYKIFLDLQVSNVIEVEVKDADEDYVDDEDQSGGVIKQKTK